MTIWICSLAAAPQLAKKLKPSRVVSLLSPYDSFPEFKGLDKDLHLQVAIHGIAGCRRMASPGVVRCRKVIRFVERWDRAAPLLIHCWAGISRSTASAFVTACVHNPKADEEEIAWAIRNASPTASPNARLVGHADGLLGRGGRMTRAIKGWSWRCLGRGEGLLHSSIFGGAA